VKIIEDSDYYGQYKIKI